MAINLPLFNGLLPPNKGKIDSMSNSFSHMSQPGSSRSLKRFFNRSPFLPLIIVIIVVAVIAFFLLKNVIDKTSGAGATAEQASIAKPLAEEKIDKAFKFPLKDQSGKEVSKFTYEVQDVELRKQIIIKGEKATAVEGRAFLIVNLKVTNNFEQSIQLNVRDYIRLTVNKSDEKLAPDIHNDPVDVQAISTKYTRIGFPINESDKDLTLLIGEIEGKKEEIHLNLK